MKNTFHILCLIFSLYFSLYAISPLSYSYNRQIDERGDTTVAGFRLFVVELLLSNIAHHKDEDKTAAILLFKKKRAAVSSGELHISGKIFKSVGKLPQGFALFNSSSAQITCCGIRSQYRKDVYLSYSGLSPPSAYL